MNVSVAIATCSNRHHWGLPSTRACEGKEWTRTVDGGVQLWHPGDTANAERKRPTRNAQCALSEKIKRVARIGAGGERDAYSHSKKGGFKIMTAKTVKVSQAVFRLYRIRTEVAMRLIEGNSAGQEVGERGLRAGLRDICCDSGQLAAVPTVHSLLWLP